MPTVRDLRRHWRELAEAAGVSPRDVDVLLGDVVEKPFSWIVAHEEDEIDTGRSALLGELVHRRLRREPLQYVRGKTEFYGRDFLVDPRVLIPRPETEHLVEASAKRIARGRRVLDVGTGSGCVAVSLALERPDLALFAADLSPAALAVAAGNATRLGARVRLFGSNVCESIGASTRVGAIVSNPPYVPAWEVPELQAEVRDWEPHMALTPGETGLEVIERILDRAPALLELDGLMLFEIGYSQSEAVARLAADGGWTAAFVADLQGIPRVAVLSR